MRATSHPRRVAALAPPFRRPAAAPACLARRAAPPSSPCPLRGFRAILARARELASVSGARYSASAAPHSAAKCWCRRCPRSRRRMPCIFRCRPDHARTARRTRLGRYPAAGHLQVRRYRRNPETSSFPVCGVRGPLRKRGATRTYTRRHRRNRARAPLSDRGSAGTGSTATRRSAGASRCCRSWACRRRRSPAWISALLAGARHMTERCAQPDIDQNPALSIIRLGRAVPATRAWAPPERTDGVQRPPVSVTFWWRQL